MVIFSCNKTIFSRGFRENICFCNKQVFVYEVPHLYKGIQHHLDSERLDWTKQAMWKRLLSCGEFPELKVEGAVPLVAIILSYRVFKCSRTCSCKRTLKISTELSKTHA